MPKPKPRKPGRPKLPKDQAKGMKLQVRLSADEYKRIETAAKGRKQTVSELARGILLATIGA
ncbi:MAG TPA: hypothetical protein VGG26_03480 [Terracidiphilus sp.]|jgi:hypothetical protein